MLEIKSEVSGKVWQLEAAVGATLNEDDSIMILESMKVEIPVSSPRKGVLREILVAEGDLVKEGQVLARMED